MLSQPPSLAPATWVSLAGIYNFFTTHNYNFWGIYSPLQHGMLLLCFWRILYTEQPQADGRKLYMNRKKAMTRPHTYRIQVQGELEERWSDRLGGMAITVDHPNEKEPVTTLSGPLRDQAALSGVLNTLYEMHLPVLSVECLDKSKE
jgi:hypothetical protein